jgi:hypothetical protein
VKSKKSGKFSIKQIETLIDTNLSKAVQTLVEGLSAEDEDGKPDWQTRVVCAKTLLNKRIPDIQRVQVRGTGENGALIVEVTKHYDGTPPKD